MRYVDGYVLPVPKKNLAAYRRIAQKAGKIWREHGALEYRECAGDDINVKWGVPFPKMIKLKPGETLVFAWIVFKSRASRSRQRQRHERPATDCRDGCGVDAVRHQTHGIRRIQGPGRRLTKVSAAPKCLGASVIISR